MLDAAQPLLPSLDLTVLCRAPARATRARARAKARAREPGPMPSFVLAPARLAALPPGPADRLESDPFRAAQLRALRQAFMGLADRWGLSGLEALTLLGEPRAADEERHERLRLLVGVHRLLLLACPEPGRCRDVLRQACPALGGPALLPFMLAGGRPAMERVRDHLAGQARA